MGQKMKLVDGNNQIWWDIVMQEFVLLMQLCSDLLYLVVGWFHLHH